MLFQKAMDIIFSNHPSGSQNLSLFSQVGGGFDRRDSTSIKTLQVVSSINICSIKLCSREQIKEFFPTLRDGVTKRLKCCKKNYILR